MGKARVFDNRVATDNALLQRMRKKSTLDFVQWTDDAHSSRVSVNRQRMGFHSTMHSVSGRMLARLPDSILNRPVAAIEFAIDFIPKQATTPAEQDRDLISTYDILHRRLAPWKGRYVSTRICRSGARGHSDEVISGKELASANPDGSFSLTIVPQRFSEKAVSTGEEIFAPTVYFGHRPKPSWDGWNEQPRVQVRLYIKVTDRGRSLPRAQWRTRVEVTLNGTPLAEILEVRSVRDLQTADMRRLVHEYVRLMSPREDQTLLIVPFLPVAYREAFERRLERIAARDKTDAVEWGNFTEVEDGLIDFHPVASLDSSLLACANGFRRAAQGAKKVKIRRSMT